MKFKMTLKDGYIEKASRVTDVIINSGCAVEIKEWMDAGYEVVLEPLDDEVKEGATDDF